MLNHILITKNGLAAEIKIYSDDVKIDASGDSVKITTKGADIAGLPQKETKTKKEEVEVES